MMNDGGMDLLAEALATLSDGFRELPPYSAELDMEAMRRTLHETAERLQDNLPNHHPLYVGQMMKPPHPVARLAHGLALSINPNNHALDGGRASSEMEKESVAQIAAMFGWKSYLGHLCSGGTMANFESLWVARELSPGKAIVGSAQSHYTHSRLSRVLATPFRAIAVDGRGRMDVDRLESELAKGDVGTVVATAGTTAAGAVDPIGEIVSLRGRYDFRLHVDAAYGGYFVLCDGLSRATQRSLACISEADSIAIDPHKHGLQPYGCGCVLFRDPGVARFYRHDSPYTYFSSSELHLGEISLECSRSGASAVALWATQRMLPLTPGGEFATGLSSCRQAALRLHESLADDSRVTPLFEPDLDIVTWAVRATSARESSAAARQVFAASAEEQLHLALARFPRSMLDGSSPVPEWDEDEITCLRACVMKPEHLAWMPTIVDRLGRATSRVVSNRR